jgi:hypothetical protein
LLMGQVCHTDAQFIAQRMHRSVFRCFITHSSE